jgi:2-(1,2-epoxy-1,2-dihydrophenyl)acetyl-CoA isomerase
MAGSAKLGVFADGAVACLRLNDPDRLNALAPDMAEALDVALVQAAEDDRVRAVLLTGTGRAFCSGADLGAARAPGADGPPDLGARLDETYNPLMRRLRAYPKPIVTAVNGAAAGIGASLALMGDLIVAAESAYFVQAFVNIGLAPDGGASWLLPRAVGKARAMELTLLGERLPARQALDWGLVNRCVPDAELEGEALALARRLSEAAASAGLIRRLMWRGADQGFAAQLDDERDTQRAAGATADFHEGVSAFLDKRPPRFSGR